MNYPGFRQLQAFAAVARLQSFGRASVHLGLSQSALSQTITLMEARLGGRLFDRTTRSVSLTALGERLLPKVTRILAEIATSFADIDDEIRLKRGEIVIGCLASITFRFLPAVLASFQATYPGITVRVKDGNAYDLKQRLLKSEIDFAISSRLEDDSDISFRPLLIDPFQLLCPRNHSLAARKVVSWASVETAGYIGYDPTTSNRMVIDRGLAAAGLSIKPMMELAQLGTVIGMVEAGVGVAAVPSMACPAHSAAVVRVRLRQPVITRELGLALPKGRSATPAAEALTSFLVKHLLKIAPTQFPDIRLSPDLGQTSSNEIQSKPARLLRATVTTAAVVRKKKRVIR
jgi:DNA-binding transcriptional LysR family regulator